MKKLERLDEIAANKVELVAFDQARSVGASLSTTMGEDSGRGSTASPLGRAGLSSHFVGPGSQPSIKSIIKKSEKVEADKVMGRCLYWSHIPLSIVKNNPFWQLMCDAIAVVGPGYKSATFEELRGPILQAEKKDIGARLTEFRQSWESTGCTVMSDGWTDG